jgi:ribosomal protein S18 acetylase RimI-like enzyme
LKVVGHIELSGGYAPSLLHRAQLRIGLEPEIHGLGFGKGLTMEALNWARKEPQLNWIDLNVFESNMAAVKLYQQFGFETISRLEDACRIQNSLLTNLAMTLNLKNHESNSKGRS